VSHTTCRAGPPTLSRAMMRMIFIQRVRRRPPDYRKRPSDIRSGGKRFDEACGELASGGQGNSNAGKKILVINRVNPF